MSIIWWIAGIIIACLIIKSLIDWTSRDEYYIEYNNNQFEKNFQNQIEKDLKELEAKGGPYRYEMSYSDNLGNEIHFETTGGDFNHQIESEIKNRIIDDNSYYQIGSAFENYVMNLFPPDKFNLIHRTIGQAEVGRYVENCYLPDLKFRSLETNEVFWVECKFRSYRLNQGTINWTDQEKLDKYRRIRRETKTKIYVIIGIGDSADRPYELFMFDLDTIPYKDLFYSTTKIIKIERRPFRSMNEIKEHNDKVKKQLSG